MIKVVHLTTVHQGLDVRIFYKQAVTLAAAGFEVSMIGSNVEAGTHKGVKVIPLPRISGRVARITLQIWRAYRLVVRVQPDICHFHDFELIPLGLMLKMRGIVVIYDVHEDVAKDLADKNYLPKWTKPILRAVVKTMEWMATRALDRVVAATEGIAKNFPTDRVTLIRNVPLLDELTPAAEIPFASRPNNVIYVGGLAPFNGVEQMIAALGELPVNSQVRLILGGRFATQERKAKMERIKGWDRVDYLGWVERSHLPQLFASARAGLVIYKPTPNIMECEPNKFFEVLSAGIPIIASNLPHWQRFIEKYECGVTVPPMDAKEIARAIQELVGDADRSAEMGNNGRIAVVTRFNWSIDGQVLVDLYKTILRTR